MYLAAISGRADVVRVLIEHKAEVNPRGDPGPLVWATFAGRPEVVEVLLDAGAETELKNRSMYESALHVAARGGFADMQSPEHATHAVRLKIAKLLIDKGANVNATGDIGYFVGSTPLHGAAHSGHVEMIKLLLDQGAKVNASSPRGSFVGYTALHAAAEAGQEEAVRLLLERKADINALTGEKNSQGICTPLDLAKNAKVRAILIKHGGKTTRELKTGDKTGVSEHGLMLQAHKLDPGTRELDPCVSADH